ncbi:TRAP transporter small permease subunit [Litoreibacter roseus]|uniref:TRAP transporter small permease protein n=1 Tax=Litoreibacter roseus TaxID=2601869 RepID=A0A6N6JJH1_9RHOB|nr:TRAP transporter small permease subunit [Litoreibacter roseus]GFE66097.1 hypothetical protein KIN_31710 [Litoreibacter roseus]
MPSLSFTLPHWLYWVGLIVFPLVAMVLSRRQTSGVKKYSVPLAYMIWVSGGIIGLHRFYLKSLLGLLYIPVFLAILYANSAEQTARTVQSNAANQVRIAERIITREEPRLETGAADIERYRTALAEAEKGSFAERSAERRLQRAEDGLEKSRTNLEQARTDLKERGPLLETARADRVFWENAALYALYVILAFMVIDALLIPSMVRRANASMTDVPHLVEVPVEEEQKKDADYAENWIDRLSLFCGEFVSYWAAIAVIVYYYEVIARYVFGSPTNWAHEAMYLMFGMQYLIAGSYAMLTESHVRVDIFYAPMRRKNKAWVDLLTSIFFFIFAGTLLVTSWIFAMDAIAVPSGNSVVSDWARGDLTLAELVAGFGTEQWTNPNIRWGEISFNEWEVPLWPMKWVMVMGGILLVLQGISKLGKDIRAIARGE